MITPVFSDKLDALPATLVLFREYDSGSLAGGIAQGACRHALSIGSGGSAIIADYLARCRDTLGLGPTTVQTPMQAVVDQHDLTQSDVRSEEHTSELQSLMRISYAVFCLKKKKK